MAYGAEGGEGAEGADGTDVAAIYILSHDKNTIGNRLYGFMGLPSKMSDGMVEWSGYPLDSYDY